MQETILASARDRILNTALRLFYRDGVRATGIDRIIAESGVAKMSFYRHFPSKNDLIRTFLEAHAQSRERQFFLRSATALWPAQQAKALKDTDLIVLAPAFTLTELTDAFKIGFLLYIGFIVVDLVIANVLMAMGLNQVQPTNVAIPFKLLLFVAMDGWSTLMHGLILGYR